MFPPRHWPASRRAGAMACPREVGVAVEAVPVAIPASLMTTRNPRRYCQYPLLSSFAAWPSHPLHDRPMPENPAWRYVVYLNSSQHYIPGLRCLRRIHIVLYLSGMKRFPRIVPTLLFVLYLVGHAVAADVLWNSTL